MDTKNRGNMRGENTATLLDVAQDHVAQEGTDGAEFTPEEDEWARNVRQSVEMRLAALRRQLTPEQPKRRRLAPIPEDLQALDRSALLARLEALRIRQSVRYAHLNLTELSTEDLRQMVATILEPPTEG
ncbi:MAG TPA: hypothetical protein VFT22_01250 [Kofleriaceae bacterium]|nr:hypothetical protein [Kofleriaceae bacterium]